jgi:hypothetical protein
MLSYNRRGNRRIRQNVRPVVWEDGGREAPSYPIGTLGAIRTRGLLLRRETL